MPRIRPSAVSAVTNLLSPAVCATAWRRTTPDVSANEDACLRKSRREGYHEFMAIVALLLLGCRGLYTRAQNFRFFRESVLCVLFGLVGPVRALRVAAENGLNHFDLAVPDFEHVHIGQPTVEVYEPGCNSGFDIGNREATMRVRHG